MTRLLGSSNDDAPSDARIGVTARVFSITHGGTSGVS
jgi:hypothetical protein